jgi:hypothetical protein
MLPPITKTLLASNYNIFAKAKNDEELLILIGKERISQYRQIINSNCDLQNLNPNDLWQQNLRLSCDYYRQIYLFETMLRNKINQEFSDYFGENWLDLNDTKVNFYSRAKEQIAEAKSRNEKKTKVNDKERNRRADQINSLHLVECLSLGFWTGLFHEYYNEQIWEHHMIEKIFPFLHSSLRGFKIINKELNLIRSFRNKVFHFANILDSQQPAINQLINKYQQGILGRLIGDRDI